MGEVSRSGFEVHIRSSFKQVICEIDGYHQRGGVPWSGGVSWSVLGGEMFGGVPWSVLGE